MKQPLPMLLSVVLALLCVAPARAQYTNPYTGRTFNNPTSSFIDTVLLNNMQTQQLLTSQMIMRNSLRHSFSRGRKKQVTPRERAVADQFAKYRGTMFTPSSKPVMSAKLAAMFIKTPGPQQQEMTKMFNKLLDIYNQRSREQNAPANDLGRTLAYCIAVNHSHYSGKDISMDDLAALRGKIRTALSGDPKFRAMSNEKKQQLSETLIIMTNFMDLGHTVSIEKKEQKGIEGFRKLAGINLKMILGVEPERVSFAKTGLIIQ